MVWAGKLCSLPYGLEGEEPVGGLLARRATRRPTFY